MLLFLLVFVVPGYESADILPEQCEDQFGADLTGTESNKNCIS